MYLHFPCKYLRVELLSYIISIYFTLQGMVKLFFFLHFLEKLIENCCYSFYKCLVEFTPKAICVWSFLCGKVNKYTFNIFNSYQAIQFIYLFSIVHSIPLYPFVASVMMLSFSFLVLETYIFFFPFNEFSWNIINFIDLFKELIFGFISFPCFILHWQNLHYEPFTCFNKLQILSYLLKYNVETLKPYPFFLCFFTTLL